MYFETLKEENIEQYLTYLKLAMEQEPDMMTAEKFDEEGIRARLKDPFYQKSTSILAMEDNQVIRATNENADRFYKKFENVQLDEEPMLRKIMREDV